MKWISVEETVREDLRKDEFGLYVNSANYSNVIADIVISSIINGTPLPDPPKE
jgi:hypothetical protein